MDREKIFLIISLIYSLLFLILTTINLILLFKIKDYSAKTEPKIVEREYSDVELDQNFRALDYSISFCDETIEKVLVDGIYKSFKFKMKKINKYSKGQIVLYFIIIGYILLGVICSIILKRSRTELFKKVKKVIFFFRCIASLISFIFFIILSVYCFKGKYGTLEDFGKCYFFNKSEFDEANDHIFKMHTRFIIYFILNILLFSMNCVFIFIVKFLDK